MTMNDWNNSIPSLHDISGWSNHITFHIAQIFNEYLENPDSYQDESRDIKAALSESETAADFSTQLQALVDKHLKMDFENMHFGRMYQEILTKGLATIHYEQIAKVLWHRKA